MQLKREAKLSTIICKDAKTIVYLTVNAIWKDDVCYKYCSKKVLICRGHLASPLVSEGSSV